MIHMLAQDDTPLGAPRLRAAADDAATEAWPACRFKPAPYRAAYWRASNRNFGGIQLTGRETLAMPPGLLVRAARENAARIGVLLGGGSIVIIGADGKDEPWVR